MLFFQPFDSFEQQRESPRRGPPRHQHVPCGSRCEPEEMPWGPPRPTRHRHHHGMGHGHGGREQFHGPPQQPPLFFNGIDPISALFGAPEPPRAPPCAPHHHGCGRRPSPGPREHREHREHIHRGQHRRFHGHRARPERTTFRVNTPLELFGFPPLEFEAEVVPQYSDHSEDDEVVDEPVTESVNEKTSEPSEKAQESNANAWAFEVFESDDDDEDVPSADDQDPIVVEPESPAMQAPSEVPARADSVSPVSMESMPSTPEDVSEDEILEAFQALKASVEAQEAAEAAAREAHEKVAAARKRASEAKDRAVKRKQAKIEAERKQAAEQAIKEELLRQQAAREQALREELLRQKVAQEELLRQRAAEAEREALDRRERERKIAEEKAAKDKAAKAKAAQEQAAQEHASKQKASREEADREAEKARVEREESQRAFEAAASEKFERKFDELKETVATAESNFKSALKRVNKAKTSEEVSMGIKAFELLASRAEQAYQALDDLRVPRDLRSGKHDLTTRAVALAGSADQQISALQAKRDEMDNKEADSDFSVVSLDSVAESLAESQASTGSSKHRVTIEDIVDDLD